MKDRLQLSTFCLLLSALGFFATGWSMHDKGSPLLGLLLCVYAVGVYVAMGFLAIDFKRWAWRVGNGAFALHLAASIPLGTTAARGGMRDWLMLGAWVLIGVVGLAANLRPGSKAAVRGAAKA